MLFYRAGSSAQQEKIWTLEDCIDFALTQNIQVRKSELSNERSLVNAAQARAQRLPSASASVNHNFNWTRSNAPGSSGFSSANGSSVSLNSGLVIFNASRLNNQIRQADLETESGLYSLETTKESVSLGILDSYLQVLYAEEQVNNSLKQLESTVKQVELAEERLATQLISLADYAQVKSQLASEKLNLANAESQLAIAKLNLAQLMELPLEGDLRVAHPDFGEDVNRHLVPNVRSVYGSALLIKPQVKNASVIREIAALDEKIAKAGYYPVLSASAGLGTNYSSVGSEGYFTQFNDGISPSVGFSLSVPIFQKNQVRTNVELARIGYQDAELSELNTRNELRKRIEQACLDVTSAQARYEASRENFLATSESASLSDEKFSLGMINSVDYLVSKTNLIMAESELLQSKYNLIFSYKVLDFYAGKPLTL